MPAVPATAETTIDEIRPEEKEWKTEAYFKSDAHDDSINRTKVVELMRYHSSSSGDFATSLKDLADHMNDDQNDICHIGESVAAVCPSLLRQMLCKKDLEVSYTTEPSTNTPR